MRNFHRPRASEKVPKTCSGSRGIFGCFPGQGASQRALRPWGIHPAWWASKPGGSKLPRRWRGTRPCRNHFASTRPHHPMDESETYPWPSIIAESGQAKPCNTIFFFRGPSDGNSLQLTQGIWGSIKISQLLAMGSMLSLRSQELGRKSRDRLLRHRHRGQAFRVANRNLFG